MHSLTRRKFIEHTGKVLAGAALGTSTLTAAQSGRVHGSNERIQLGLIGCGGRGRVLAHHLVEQGGDVVWLCDVDPQKLELTATFIRNRQAGRFRTTGRYEDVLADGKVDAVVIGTPDHWHALLTIRACQAGKDVYVEKPQSHCVWECRQMIAAARKYRRIVQVGTQNRSGKYVIAAREYIESGQLGSIHLVKVFNALPPGSFPFYLGDPGAKPPGLDWDRWLGPAPERDWHERIYKGGWHQFWDYSGGNMLDDGIHQLDLALMMAGDRGLPEAVACAGGRLAHRGDDSETPDVQIVTYDYPDMVMTLENTQYPRYMRKTAGSIRRSDEFPYWTDNSTRIEIYGSDRLMFLGRHGGGWQVLTVGGRVVDQMYGRPGEEEHIADFFECIRSRRRPNADVEVVHAATVMGQMGNIAYRVGNRKLRIDRDNERFIDDEEANKHLKRSYRAPYVIEGVV